MTGSKSLYVNHSRKNHFGLRFQQNKELVIIPNGKQATVTVAKEIAGLSKGLQERIGLLEGTADLLAERQAYILGRADKQTDMNKATKTERSAASTIRTGMKEGLKGWLKDGNLAEFEKQETALAEASKVVSVKSKPFRKEIAPLAKGIKFINNVCIPDTLDQLGIKPKAAFVLSEFIQSRMKEQEDNA